MCDRMRQDGNAFKHAEDVLEALRTADNDDDRLLFLRDTLIEGYRWRKIATYLAEVHAANAEYWTSEWPIEPGTYLFRGCKKITHSIHIREFLMNPRVVRVVHISDGSLSYMGDEFMYPKTWYGMWKKLDFDHSSVHPRFRYLLFLSSVWSALVSIGGARDGSWERDSFFQAFTTDPPSEWRFQGDLGFGGKLYRAEKWRVGCYPDDMTPEREQKLAKLNIAIEAIAEEYEIDTISSVPDF